MNVKQPTHPTERQLRNFAAGSLHGEAFSRVEQHLLACDSCCEKLAATPDSTLLRLARDAATIGFRDRTSSKKSDTGQIPAELADHPRYEVIKQIGQGGMGAVYLARHRMMHREVALKIIRPGLLADEKHVERFRREVQGAARLSHPNIVTAFDADEAGDLNFLAMEYVAGSSLGEAIAQQLQMPVEQACEWARQAALGLQHAHEQGMVHRDIKPHNLMLTPDGTIKILDFGLTRLDSELSQNSQTAPPSPTSQGMILGTPDYIAPEQITDSAAADIRADIYSLGCTLFQFLTGGPPFPRGTILEKLHAHGSTPLPRLDSLRPEIPAAVVKIVGRMTAKSPAERFATPGEVARELEPYCARQIGAPPVAPPLARRGVTPLRQRTRKLRRPFKSPPQFRLPRSRRQPWQRGA